MADAKAMLAQVPMTVAIDASGIFQSYRSGVISTTSGCGTSLNHAVTLVGYTEKGSVPPPPPGPVNCDVHKWWHSCSASGRLLADANGYENYWKIQNSWGTGWGDAGFVLIEITDGTGVCGINSYMEYAKPIN